MKRVSGVLLAAGGSRRLGHPKQLLEWQGETLVRRAAQCAIDAGVDELIVVLGCEADRVARALDGLAATLVVNEDWPAGLGASIARGVSAVSGDGVLIQLADQPAVDARLLERLIDAGREGHARVACAYGKRFGVPALFSAAADLARLADLAGDAGARSLLAEESDRVFAIDAPQASIDIDTDSDWAHWQNERSGR